MPEFQYRAVDPDGREVKGVVVASNPAEAEETLRQRGYIPLSVSEPKRKLPALRLPFLGRVSTRELLTFTNQFYAVTSSGMSLFMGLDYILPQVKNKRLYRAVLDIRRRLEHGEGLYEAFSAHRDIFPPLFLGALRAGEAGGNLTEVLADLVRSLERQDDFEGELKQALTYPSIVAVALVAVGLFYLKFVLPKVLGLVSEMGTEIPMITRWVKAFVDLFQTYWYVAFLAPVVLFAAWKLARQTESGRLWTDRVKLRLPVAGEILQKALITRFSRYMALLVEAGIDVVEALALVAQAIGNAVFAQGILMARERIQAGDSLGRALIHVPMVPLALGMIAIGEETGRLTTQFEKIAEYYEKDVTRSVKRALTLIEPALLVVFGAFAAVALFSILLPIYNAVTQVTR